MWLFTADLVVRLGDMADAPERAATAASALREVSQAREPSTDLPPPPSAIMALVSKACGQKPGDHGPSIED